MVPADKGEILVGGQTVTIRSPRDARELGLGMVHQHFTTVPAMTVEENVWLAVGRYGGRTGKRRNGPTGRWAGGRAEGPAALQRLWGGLAPRARGGTRAGAQKQRPAILKAPARDARLPPLAEPPPGPPPP